MDWQLLVNKAAEVESKIRSRGSRNHRAYIVRTSDRGMQVKGLAAQTLVAAQQIADAEKALREAKANAYCEHCRQSGHPDAICWKQGNAPMPKHVKRRQEKEKKAREAKGKRGRDDKDKDDRPSKRGRNDKSSVPTNSAFVEDSDEEYSVGMAIP